jgi:TorA maturation chaperone TorD
MGEAHASALEWYTRYGAAPRAAGDPADHIGLLLTFYAQLLAAGADADERQLFANRHLAWIPAFARSVATESRCEFYTRLGQWVQEMHTEDDGSCKHCAPTQHGNSTTRVS